MGCRTFSAFWGQKIQVSRDLIRKIFTAFSLTNVSIYSRKTQLKGFIRQMYKQKITKLGSPKLHLSKSDLRWGL